MSKICGECVFFPGCSRYEGKTHDSEEAETCRAYLACEEDEEEVAAGVTPDIVITELGGI